MEKCGRDVCSSECVPRYLFNRFLGVFCALEVGSGVDSDEVIFINIGLVYKLAGIEFPVFFCFLFTEFWCDGSHFILQRSYREEFLLKGYENA